MASVGSSLSPQSIAAVTLEPLDRISSSLDTLVQTLQTSTTFTALTGIVTDITAADNDLSNALQLLKQHQANYARILQLRDEANSLENNIKDTIRRARQLRSEITSIHPSIDDDGVSDEEGDGLATANYDQLLQFAARIGKHNSLAKQAAEQEGTRLKIDAQNARRESEALQATQLANGTDHHAADDATAGALPDLITYQADELTAKAEAFEASSRLPFPAPEVLRQGALGRLEILRESDPGDPDGAVEREVERMVRATENVAAASAVTKPTAEQQKTAETTARPREQPSAGVSSQRPSGSTQQSTVPKPPKKKVDLDFPGADSDDDDDD